ncbi:hypothetical protein Y032_0178g635 [Ancylostoma ceylanicum]|uniref:Uncharacterized protein n=1 Tax=Ancylostoma ceylanicum TaxID=53326 RepID=A0A016STR9_9BILA|nr:hypothetical protein Y032_0178g635 [Ancylostoma ceylanicum]
MVLHISRIVCGGGSDVAKSSARTEYLLRMRSGGQWDASWKTSCAQTFLMIYVCDQNIQRYMLNVLK